MEARKRENRIKEMMVGLKDERYRSLLVKKIDWLDSCGVLLVPFSNASFIQSENISFGGKVSWDINTSPKKPLKLTLNMIHFSGPKLLIAFLHECGHIKDKDNDSINLKTPQSEISAWHHAIADFHTLPPTQEEKHIFMEMTRHGLRSYGVDESIIDTILSEGNLS